MPTRIIRDGILTSERINKLSLAGELFYRRLMSVADDHGRYSAHLTQLRAYCYPMRLDTVKESDIAKWLAECVSASLIVTYTVANKPFLQVTDFGQRINGKSKFPDIPRESPGIPGVSRLDVDVDVDVDEGERPAAVAATPRAKAVTLTTWLASLAEPEAIPADDPIFAYADKVGLPQTFLELSWAWFHATYTNTNTAQGAKRYADWRAVYRNAVRGGWGNLWKIGATGEYFLTSQGVQAQREFGL